MTQKADTLVHVWATAGPHRLLIRPAEHFEIGLKKYKYFRFFPKNFKNMDERFNIFTAPMKTNI